MINTRRPLEEKLALFWHHVFGTGFNKLNCAGPILTQIELFGRDGLGSFRTLLSKICKDPAMHFWLDNHENIQLRANENVGRELLELFTLGIGNYTDKDVQSCARFTGWTFSRGRA